MSVVRRVLFRRAAGAVAATTIAARNAQAVAGAIGAEASMDAVGYASAGSAMVGSKLSRDPKWDDFYALKRAAEHVEERENDVIRRLGMPPHLASMNSCAPWFLQQRAAIWIQERTESQKTLWERIRRQMGLE